jgi:hypothetical protein
VTVTKASSRAQLQATVTCSWHDEDRQPGPTFEDRLSPLNLYTTPANLRRAICTAGTAQRRVAFLPFGFMIETQSSLMPKSLQWVRSPAAAMVINARLRRSDAAAAYTVIMANPRGLRGLELAGVTERRHEPVAGLPAVADNAPPSAGFEVGDFLVAAHGPHLGGADLLSPAVTSAIPRCDGLPDHQVKGRSSRGRGRSRSSSHDALGS